MNLTLEQKNLLEQVLLNMSYDSKKTRSENLLKEQPDPKTIQTKLVPTLNIKDTVTSVDNLSVQNLFTIAKKWGWVEPNWIPVALVDSEKQKIKIGDAKSFLKKLGWPKFGIPTKSKIDVKNPEYIKKINFINMIKGGLEGGPYGSTDPRLKSGYNECIEYANPSFITPSTLEVYETKYDYCYVNYERYKPPYVEGDFNLDPHIVLQVSALVLLFLGPVGVVLSGVLEAADIALYLKENDYEMAGIALAFSLIPGSVLLTKIPVIGNFTKGALRTFLKKFKKGIELDPLERKLKEELRKHGRWIIREIAKNGAKLSLKLLFSRKIVGRKLVRLMIQLIRFGLLTHRTGVRLTCLGGAFISFGWIGKKLGEGLEYLDTGNLEKLDPETAKKLKEVNPKVMEKEIIQMSEEISNENEEMIEKLIDVSEAEKNDAIRKVLERAKEEMDNYKPSQSSISSDTSDISEFDKFVDERTIGLNAKKIKD